MRVSHVLCLVAGAGVGFLAAALTSPSGRSLQAVSPRRPAVEANDIPLQLERTPRPSEQADEPATARREAIALLEQAEVPATLWADLDRLCALGVLDCPTGLVQLVVRHLTFGASSAEKAAHAAELVRRWKPTNAASYHMAVSCLLRFEDPAGARELVELGMEHASDVRGLAASLLSVGELERAEALLGRNNWNEWERLARAYKKRGDLGEAVRVHRMLVERGMFLNDSLALLSEHDPALLEEKLREDYAQEPDAHSVKSLAKLLHETGRSAEGIELLDGNEHLVNRTQLLATLTEIDPDEARLRFREEEFAKLPIQERDDLWHKLAKHYQNEGRIEDAVEGWIEQLSMTPDDPWSSMEVLVKHAPERGLTLMERRAAEVANPETRPKGMDESDIADFQDCLGDHAWELGKKELAIRAWKQARGFDQEDDYYGRKALAAEQGCNPLMVE